jgi:hypothetical protein
LVAVAVAVVMLHHVLVKLLRVKLAMPVAWCVLPSDTFLLRVRFLHRFHMHTCE